MFPPVLERNDTLERFPLLSFGGYHLLPYLARIRRILIIFVLLQIPLLKNNTSCLLKSYSNAAWCSISWIQCQISKEKK